MEIAQTYIVKDNGRVIPLYVAYDNRYFISYDETGQLIEITESRAKELSQTELKKG